MLSIILEIITTLALTGLGLYGFLGFYTLYVFQRHRQDPWGRPHIDSAQLPPVTVQLPLYNERYVIDRLIGAAARLQYPRDRLQIQILDDSEDDTTARVARLAQQYRAKGLQIQHVRRRQRAGFKAGALGNGLDSATGDFVAIFDADFEPAPDFLLRTVPHFLQCPKLGLVQTRWGHLNGAESTLTAAQALALDKHFVVEQTVRFRANLFPKFNGTAGVWRRTCLEDAGGWQSDTVCEDLCLSTRAVLRGWQCRYLSDVVAPAELPASITSYKNQQSRWAKGSTQCLLKFGKQIALSRKHSRAARLYALLSMAAYSTSFLLIVLLLAQMPLALMRVQLSSSVAVLSVAGVGQPLLFVLSQQLLYRDWKRRIRHLPSLLLIAIGMSATISRAVIEAVFGNRHTFVRTPKRGAHRQQHAVYRLPFDSIVFVELFLALYAVLSIGVALWQDILAPLPFLGSCALGFGLVAAATFRDQTA